MNSKEIGQLVTLAFGCFQNQNASPSLTKKSWEFLISDLHYELALEALKCVLNKSKFFPTVAEIREEVKKIESIRPIGIPIEFLEDNGDKK